MIAPELLRLSDLFAARQESPENLPHLGLAVLFLSSSEVNPTLRKILPPHFERYRQVIALRYPTLLQGKPSSVAPPKLDLPRSLLVALTPHHLQGSGPSRLVATVRSMGRLDSQARSAATWTCEVLFLAQDLATLELAQSESHLAPLSAALRRLVLLRSTFVGHSDGWQRVLSLTRFVLAERALRISAREVEDEPPVQRHHLHELRTHLQVESSFLGPLLVGDEASLLVSPSATGLIPLLLSALKVEPFPHHLEGSIDQVGGVSPIELLSHLPLALSFRGYIAPERPSDLFLAVCPPPLSLL